MPASSANDSRVTDNRAVDTVARVGLVARGVVYVLVAWVALEIARGHGGRKEADRKGAVQLVAAQPFGHALLVLLALAFAGYALWRVIGAVQADDVGDRVRWAGMATLYAAFAVSTGALLRGRGDAKPGDTTKPLSARVMTWPGGRVLAFVVGAAIVIGGLELAWRGVRHDYEGADDVHWLDPSIRPLADWLARVGNTARGLVFAFAGAFLAKAAVDFDPNEARSLDGTLRTLRDGPAGPWLLGAVAVGLLAYGVSSLLEARYRRI